jgi:hypothetical protein
MTTPCDDPWLDVAVGDSVLIENSERNASVRGIVDSTNSTSPWLSIEGVTGSFHKSAGWELTVIARVVRPPSQPGWYISKEALRAHGYGSSIRLYRRDSANWFRTTSNERMTWEQVGVRALPQDLLSLEARV